MNTGPADGEVLRPTPGHADQRQVTPLSRIAISFGFLGVAFVAGYLAHSTGVFTTIMGVGLIAGILLRLVR